MKPERVTLVLSGGGMKAMAHVGVLRALDEMDIRPSCICAVSAGAMVGAMAASGMRYAAIASAAITLTARDVAVLNRTQLTLRGVGALSILRGEPLRRLLSRVLPEQSFERLAVPLRVGVTDLDRGELVAFGSGGRLDWTVAKAVYASMALPLYVPPLQVGGTAYGDGGVLEVLPLSLVLLGDADRVIAVDVGPSLQAREDWLHAAPRLIAQHDRTYGIQTSALREHAVAAWKADASRPPLVLIRPAVDPHATFAFDRTAGFIEAGYRAAHAALAARGMT